MLQKETKDKVIRFSSDIVASYEKKERPLKFNKWVKMLVMRELDQEENHQ
ncbi:MAG: hypothetical protein ACOCUR_00810 [Nanoarchaeota archaeon]